MRYFAIEHMKTNLSNPVRSCTIPYSVARTPSRQSHVTALEPRTSQSAHCAKAPQLAARRMNISLRDVLALGPATRPPARRVSTRGEIKG